MFLSIYVSSYLSIYLSVHLSVYLSIYLSIYVFIYSSFCLTINRYTNIHGGYVHQDPYHGRGQAMGLAFSVPRGMMIPPSTLAADRRCSKGSLLGGSTGVEGRRNNPGDEAPATIRVTTYRTKQARKPLKDFVEAVSNLAVLNTHGSYFFGMPNVIEL